ncbi:hypothetical protein B0H14DRAFT_2559498 [Mycena olivaceomarginata]|nr:hypothetical protein B0H14DRAFT_2559498 [Mycena olivaceomarginata]
MAPRFAPAKPVTGPPQALISRIEHLADLLHNLPSSLPEKPSHPYGGHFSAVSHALEVSFETHLLGLQGRTLVFAERGERLDTLVKFLKTGVKHMSPGERTTFQGAWIEQLITGAVDSGAKKHKAPVAASATHENVPATKEMLSVDEPPIDPFEEVPTNHQSGQRACDAQSKQRGKVRKWTVGCAGAQGVGKDGVD